MGLIKNKNKTKTLNIDMLAKAVIMIFFQQSANQKY